MQGSVTRSNSQCSERREQGAGSSQAVRKFLLNFISLTPGELWELCHLEAKSPSLVALDHSASGCRGPVGGRERGIISQTFPGKMTFSKRRFFLKENCSYEHLWASTPGRRLGAGMLHWLQKGTWLKPQQSARPVKDACVIKMLRAFIKTHYHAIPNHLSPECGGREGCLWVDLVKLRTTTAKVSGRPSSSLKK